MDIFQLTELMEQFVNDQGWYNKNSPKPQTLKNLVVSLNLETSELLEYFQWIDELENPHELAEELADVALYLIQIARIAGINLEDAILRKLEKNYTRKWTSP